MLVIITHEIGHCLGFGHSHTNWNSIMSYAWLSGSNGKLGLDDMAGLIFLYPDPNYGSDVKETVACGTIGNKTGAGIPFLLILPLLLAGIALVRKGQKT